MNEYDKLIEFLSIYSFKKASPSIQSSTYMP